MDYTETRTKEPVFDKETVTSTMDVQEQKSETSPIHIETLELDDTPECIKPAKTYLKKGNFMFNTQNLNVVEHPDHYGAGNGGLQCIEAMLQTFGKDATMAFCKLNSFKYIWRSDHKEKEVQDMEKAKRYLEYWHVLSKLESDTDDGSFHEYLNS